jgi:hypothetical protein
MTYSLNRVARSALLSLALIPSIAAGSLLAARPSHAQAEPPSYDHFHEGKFLRYLNAHEIGGINEVPRIGLAFGERVLHAVIDSGSTGIVVAAAYIPNFESLPVVGDGRLTYTSSGRVMVGRWVMTPVELVGQEGERIRTVPMPVLGVTEVRCLEHARDCTPNDQPRNIAMVGVGFGREGDSQSQSTPDKNPLLRIETTHEYRRGYVLAPTGVHIGLTEANTRGDFKFVKLSKRPDDADWAGTPACIVLNAQMPPACGSMLVDTGVSAMFMTVPPEQAAGAQGSLPPSTNVSIRVGMAENSSELYSFQVGADSPLAPNGIHLRVANERAFVNTSFHLLNGYDVLYDADAGYVGFRRRSIP